MVTTLTVVCANAPAETTNTPLTFYLVNKQKTDDAQLFDSFPFPKLGYISSKPDLVVEHIKEVTSLPESSCPGWAVDHKSGESRKVTIITPERFFFTLHNEDAARLRRLAEKAGPKNQLVLVLFGDKAIHLLRPQDVEASAQFEVIGNWGGAKVKEIADALKDLVQ